MSKLSISAETASDRYDVQTTVRCYECNVDNVDKTSGKLAKVIEGVMNANTFSKDAEVKAWELEITTCKHILTLRQEEAKQIDSQDLGHCSSCELKENLWLCVQCGTLGCGRQQFGGIKGNGHAMEHAAVTGHGVAVKLGSITPEGTADVYCYTCDDERIDNDLGTHLAHWGIILADRQKTEKSLTELQVEQNMNWEFQMTDEKGQGLEPLFGKGLTGLKNIGNSCYLASIVQCLFALPQFQSRYYELQGEEEDLPLVDDPAEDLETQMRKLADGLLSGRYSRPESDVTSEVTYQKGIAPSMFKHLVGRGHAEFATMRQQDAFEFLQHLFTLITRSCRRAPHQDPVQAFKFVTEQKLKCASCSKVRFSTVEQDNISVPVPMRKLPKNSIAEGEEGEKAADVYESVSLKECLDIFTGVEMVELSCAACGKNRFYKQTFFKTFPEVLAINARRFNIINWVPVKLDIPVVVSDERFSLDSYRSPPRDDSEELLPEEAETKPDFVPNEMALQQLEQMGFPRNRCERGLHATGNSDANAAMEWLFAHMDDPDIDGPLVLGGAPSSAIDPESVDSLCGMGFTKAQALKALQETGGSIERAIEWLFSHSDDLGDLNEGAPPRPNAAKEQPGSEQYTKFQLRSIVCHKGGNVHVGHYVSFIRKKEGWVLFNDEKVVKASDVEEMKKFAYVYFFERLGFFDSSW